MQTLILGSHVSLVISQLLIVPAVNVAKLSFLSRVQRRLEVRIVVIRNQITTLKSQITQLPVAAVAGITGIDQCRLLLLECLFGAVTAKLHLFPEGNQLIQRTQIKGVIGVAVEQITIGNADGCITAGHHLIHQQITGDFFHRHITHGRRGKECRAGRRCG